MNKPSGLASKLRALLKAKEAPMWGVIIVLVIVIIFQQIQISELQWRVDEDHDGSTIDSVAGRLYILEGMANKHSDQLDEILKDIRQLQNDGAKYDWELKHPPSFSLYCLQMKKRVINQQKHYEIILEE